MTLAVNDMFCDCLSVWERRKVREKERLLVCVCMFVCQIKRQRKKGKRAALFFQEHATPENTNLAFLCFLPGLWIEMSPPLDSAPVGDQQCVTDRRVEPVVAVYCVASNCSWLSSAWSNEWRVLLWSDVSAWMESVRGLATTNETIALQLRTSIYRIIPTVSCSFPS